VHLLEGLWGYATTLFVITCDYVSFATSFATNVQLLSSSSSYANDSSMNKPPWFISCMCNQNIVTNWCIIKKSIYIIINIYYEYYQHICKGFNVNFLSKVNSRFSKGVKKWFKFIYFFLSIIMMQ